MRLKFLLSHIDERKVTEGTELLSVSKSKGVVPRSAISDEGGRAESISHYKTCQPGDIVINRMSAYQGALGLARLRGAVSPDYMVLRPNDEVEPRFMTYLLKSHWMVSTMSSLVKGIGSVESGKVRTPRLNWSDLKQVDVQIPAPGEQRRIADHLDAELQQIEALSRAQEALASALTRRTNAEIISWATTGNTERLTSPSADVPWIEKIPEHWDVRPFYWAGKEVKRPNPFAPNPTILSLSYGNLIEKKNTNQGLNPANYDSYQHIEPGDIVFRFTDLQNDKKSLRSAIAVRGGLITSAYMAYQPIRIQPEFLGYLMRAYDLLGVFYGMGSGLRQSLRFSEIRTMPVLVPPLEEQRRIVEHLQRKQMALKEGKSRALSAVALLTERKVALISSLVIAGGK